MEDTYYTWKGELEELEKYELQEELEAIAFGQPDEDFEETTTEITTNADGSITTKIVVTTSTGSTTTMSTI